MLFGANTSSLVYKLSKPMICKIDDEQNRTIKEAILCR